MPMFNELFKGDLQLFKLHFGTITLPPKKEEAFRIVQFRPIFLLSVSFKIFTGVGVNCLTKVAHTMVQPTQIAFMRGRHILEGVVVVHETLHKIRSKKLAGLYSKWILRRLMTR